MNFIDSLKKRFPYWDWCYTSDGIEARSKTSPRLKLVATKVLPRVWSLDLKRIYFLGLSYEIIPRIPFPAHSLKEGLIEVSIEMAREACTKKDKKMARALLQGISFKEHE